MTPEEIEQILQSNAKAIQANSDGIAELRRQMAEITRRMDATLAQMSNTTTQISSSINQLTSTIATDHALTYQRLTHLEDNQTRLIDILRNINNRVQGLEE